MPRPVILYTAQWTRLPIDELVLKAAEWGYQGLELACWGDHFEVQRALAEPDYCPQKLQLCTRNDLRTLVLSNHKVGQAICDVIDDRHQDLVPDYVWGDGKPTGVQERAAEEMLATLQAAQRLGVSVVTAFSGSPIWSYVLGYPGPTAKLVDAGYADFARRFTPILDFCKEIGVKLALEIHPGQLAFDLYSTERLLDAVAYRPELGLTFDPSHFHWQGVDPVEILRRFAERIYHVHIKDCSVHLSGRSSLLGSYLPYGDPRRGWDFRAPGRGGIDWENVLRGLNEIRYAGPLSVEFKDAGMSAEYGAAEACQFVKRLDFEPAEPLTEPS